jgi:acyl-CoA reductase-like NAD-dependent aldehyde dehydrogenase
VNAQVFAEALPAEDGGASAWAERNVRDRLNVLRKARHTLARRTGELADAIPSALARSRADTLVAEVLPLLAACRFLERNAARILQPRRLGRRGLPFWLAGVESTVERVPLGWILVIGPANYPLFLPGVQVLQGLAAGNSVVWKPGLGGRAVGEIVLEALHEAGLPESALRVTGESVEEGVEAMRGGLHGGVDKIFFTGSGAAGRAVLRAAAETVTPVVAELSGCDAVVVLPSANVERVLAALEFGMRLNGSATCMAPRRLMLVGEGHASLILALRSRFAAMQGVLVNEAVRAHLRVLVEEAAAEGATVCGDVRCIWLKPLLVLNATPEMQVAQADVFAPVLSVLQFGDVDEMLRAEAVCPFGLTAAIFGEEREATRLGDRMKVGTLLVNDLLVPTADPRVPFGGRRGSGFGATRGAEGLLEMTAVKTVLVRRGKSARHYEATGETHEAMFAGLIAAGHGGGWGERWAGMRRMIGAAKKLKAETR